MTYDESLSILRKLDYEAYAGCKAYDFADDFLSSNPITLEVFCMKEHVGLRQLPRLVTEVLVDWELAGETHASLPEARYHLINHLRIKIRNERCKSTSPDKHAARRGTGVGDHTENDYGGPF